MKIYNGFMFYDEKKVLNLRLNCMNAYVDKFIIVESSYTHSGEKRKLLFDVNKFKKFKEKIIYIVLDEQPTNLSEVEKSDVFFQINSKYILNALKRENLQRNAISRGLKNAEPDDVVIVSDVDEIPNLEKLNFKEIKNKILLFKQKFYYYKFNLKLEAFNWYGTKACIKKNLISPQWLRNIKDKKYSFWRLDTIFSKKKYNNIEFIENGGWHFSNMKSPQDIEKKMKTYLHHREYDVNPLGIENIKKAIENKKSVYNLKTDSQNTKIDGTQSLIVSNVDELPLFIKDNKDKYKDWLEKN